MKSLLLGCTVDQRRVGGILGSLIMNVANGSLSVMSEGRCGVIFKIAEHLVHVAH